MNVGIMAEIESAPVKHEDLEDIFENCWMYCGVMLKPASNMAEAEFT